MGSTLSHFDVSLIGRGRGRKYNNHYPWTTISEGSRELKWTEIGVCLLTSLAPHSKAKLAHTGWTFCWSYVNVFVVSFPGVSSTSTTMQQPGTEPCPDIHRVHCDLRVECGSQRHNLSSHVASDCGLFLYRRILRGAISWGWQACVQDFVFIARCAVYIPTLQKWKPQYWQDF